MPIPALDLIVLGVTLISAVLATIRGATREILAILAWVVAAAAALLLHKAAEPFVKNHIANETIAKVAAIAGIFLLTLLVVSIITVRISDMILDSRIGALDRTLGFLFGLARGLLIMVVAFLFFAWLVPDKQQPDWVRSAKSKVMLQGTGDWLMGLLPDDPENTILKRFKKKGDEEQTDAAPEPRSTATVGNDGGYGKSARDGLKQLIEGKPAGR